MLPTEHFVMYFHQGEDRQAQHLATIAEETWHALQRPMGTTPPRLTHVVLADQTELPNGYATPLPYDTIVIYAVWPSGADFDFDDWLRLAFTHEFTHVVHLDRSEGWARSVRSLFGRTAFAFPNVFLPAWQIEGLAVFEESAITGTGRLHAGDFRAIVAEAARHNRLEPLDRVNGGLTDWPGGAAVYAYGSEFHQYLADRFGLDRLAALADATARSIPYTASRAFHRVYGQPLGRLFRDYEAGLAGNGASRPVDSGITRLTRHGFSVSGPRFDRFVCPTCPAEVLYSAVNAHGFPALYRVGLAGADPREVTTRYLGSTTAIGREGVYFDQMERRRNVGLYSDLYEWSRTTGRVRQLTQEARLLDPDLSPDGTTLVCVQDRPGQRDLVLVRLPAPRSTEGKADTTYDIILLISETDTQFDAPKWSPDGRTIVVERHRRGAMPEIVLVDVTTKGVRVLLADPHTRYVMPTWRPDGAAVVAAVAPEDQTFNLFEYAVEGSSSRQLTYTTGGATWPDVSPDGQTLVFVGYTIDGYDLFSMPYPPPAKGVVQAFGEREQITINAETSETAQKNPWNSLRALRALRSNVVFFQADAGLKARTTSDYSPLKTLRPTSWSPVIETGGDQVRVGAAVAGFDVLGYHAYAASATWVAARPDGALAPSATTPDWQISYAYDRWRPTLYAAASGQTSFFAGPATDAGMPATATRRSREVEAGVLLPIRHTRVLHAGRLSVVRAVDDYTTSESAFSRARTPLRAGWETLTARRYGYSISQERGVAVGVTAEAVRSGLSSLANATIATADTRAYLPGFASHHVVAVRAAGGASTGDSTAGRTFLLGGDSPGDGLLDFGGSAFSLLRGFASHTFAGSHVALVNAEYRWPIARPQRGAGTWPLFLHTLHGAVFADAGQAWTRTFRGSAVKTSVGAQLSTDFVAGYFIPLTATVGAAWGHDGSGAVAGGATFYVRVGKGF